MMLYGKTDDEYFRMLSEGKKHEFRQIEGMILENKQTGETKQFSVKNIFLLDPARAEAVKKNYSKVPWEDKPVFAIELGDEIVSVHVPILASDQILDRNPVEYEKPWYAVTE